MKYGSDFLKGIHESAQGLHRAGLISAERMKEYDVMCSKSLSRTGDVYKSNWKSNAKIAFIHANWCLDIVDDCRNALFANLDKIGIESKQIDIFAVPGSFEIPLLAKQLSKKGQYDLIVGCGIIKTSEIFRHDFVVKAIIKGLMKVQLESEIPILSAVLTPQIFPENSDYRRFFSSHFKKRGQEVGSAAKLVLMNKQRLLNY